MLASLKIIIAGMVCCLKFNGRLYYLRQKKILLNLAFLSLDVTPHIP